MCPPEGYAVQVTRGEVLPQENLNTLVPSEYRIRPRPLGRTVSLVDGRLFGSWRIFTFTLFVIDDHTQLVCELCARFRPKIRFENCQSLTHGRSADHSLRTPTYRRVLAVCLIPEV